MSADSRITQQAYIENLKQQSDKGQVASIRLTNKRTIPLDFLMEPLGDEAPPLAPGASYDVITQVLQGEYGLGIDIEDDCIRVWLISPTGTEGNVFCEGVSVLNRNDDALSS